MGNPIFYAVADITGDVNEQPLKEFVEQVKCGVSQCNAAFNHKVLAQLWKDTPEDGNAMLHAQIRDPTPRLLINDWSRMPTVSFGGSVPELLRGGINNSVKFFD